MLDHRDRVAASIASAQTNLDQAMIELAAMSSFSYGAVAFAAHALNNYLSVVSGVTDLMGIVLTDYPDPRIHNWLDGIQRSTRMMARPMASGICGQTASPNASTMRLAATVPRGPPTAMRD